MSGNGYVLLSKGELMDIYFASVGIRIEKPQNSIEFQIDFILGGKFFECTSNEKRTSTSGYWKMSCLKSPLVLIFYSILIDTENETKSTAANICSTNFDAY